MEGFARRHLDERELGPYLARAAERLVEIGRASSELALLRHALRAPGKLPPSYLRRAKALAEDGCDIETARAALRALRSALEGASKPAEQREYTNLAGSELAVLDRLDELLRPGTPAPPVPGRLLYVLHHSRPWLSNGYATRGHGLAQGMIAAGIDLVCATRPGFPLDVRKELETAPESDSLDAVDYLRALEPRRSGPGRSRRYLLDAADVLERRIRECRPQAVMAASNYVAALPALIAARRTGLPFAYEVRGFWEITEVSREPERAETFTHHLKLRLEAKTAAAADRVFTLSTPMAQELTRRGVEAERIALLPNSCDPEHFRPQPRDSDLARRLNIPRDVPVIGYIGSFVPYEGLDDLTEACAALRRQGHAFRLVLVGADDGLVHERITEIAHAQGLADWLILPGRVPHEEVSAWYSLIDIAPFPRKPQPVTELVTPLKPLEAMAMEKAVVMSSVGAMAEMVRDGETGLVFDKGNPAALAGALARLVGDAQLRARLGRNARAFVAAERTWVTMGERVRGWLQSLPAARRHDLQGDQA